MAVDWTYENAAHLLRRVAFGGPPEHIQEMLDRHSSVDSAVDEILGWRVKPNRPPAKKDDSSQTLAKMQKWWLKKMIKYRRAGDGAREKMVLFLHDHLVSGADKLTEYRWLAYQNRLFRINARGNFKQLMRDFNRDPANLIYLDGVINRASDDGVHVNANENWGRELVELFTLGVFQLAADGTPDASKPNYTEDDVHNLARASTGWTGEFVKELGTYVGTWKPSQWDGGQYDDDGDGLPDTMTIFGISSDNFRIDEGVAGTSDDILELIFSRTDDDGNNQVGMFLSSKLWTWYAYPPPAPGLKSLLAGFAATFAANNFELAPLLRAMWTSDEFFSDAAKRRTVKTPADYVVQALRAFNVRGNAEYLGSADRTLGEMLERMGMLLFEPPNVAGWPGGLSWINAGTLLERMTFAKEMAGADYGSNRLKLRKVKTLPWGDPAVDPAVVVDTLVHQIGLDVPPTVISVTQRQGLLDFATDNGAITSLDLTDEYTDDVTVKVRGLISLLVQMAESQIH